MLRFSLRDIVLTLVATAIGLAWCLDHLRLTTQIENLEAEIAKQSAAKETAEENAREAWRVMQHTVDAEASP